MARFPRDVPRHARAIVLGTAAVLFLSFGAQALSMTAASAAKHHGHPAVLVLTKQNASLGTYLASAKGFTLYTFTLDSNGKSACAGGCATVWPPVLVPKGAKLSSLVKRVKASKLGKIKRSNGTFQLTYKGKPLYRFQGDKSAGQTTGQGFENDWFVATLSGVTTPPTTAATTPTAAAPQASSNTSSSSSSSSSSHPASGSGSSSPPPPPTTTPPPSTTTPTPPPSGGGGYGY